MPTIENWNIISGIWYIRNKNWVQFRIWVSSSHDFLKLNCSYDPASWRVGWESREGRMKMGKTVADVCWLVADIGRGLLDTQGAHGRVCSGNCELYVDPLTVIKNCPAEHHLPPPGEQDCSRSRREPSRYVQQFMKCLSCCSLLSWKLNRLFTFYFLLLLLILFFDYIIKKGFFKWYFQGVLLSFKQ